MIYTTDELRRSFQERRKHTIAGAERPDRSDRRAVALARDGRLGHSGARARSTAVGLKGVK